MIELRKNGLAFYDSFSGMVKCKVLSIEGDENCLRPSTRHVVKVQFTSCESPVYQYGEIREFSSLHVIPRNAFSRNHYSMTIKPYWVICDSRVD